MTLHFQAFDDATGKLVSLSGTALAAALQAANPAAGVVSLTNDEGSDVVIGQPVVTKGDLTFEEAIATSEGGGAAMFGLVNDATIVNGVAGNIIVGGILSLTAGQTGAITASGATALTPETELILSTTRGKITWVGSTAVPSTPGEVLVRIGYAVGNNEILVAPHYLYTF